VRVDYIVFLTDDLYFTSEIFNLATKALRAIYIVEALMIDRLSFDS
jgi:hypothetical protein